MENEIATREEMKKMAIQVLEKLGVAQYVIRDLKRKERRLYESEGFGALYYLNDEEMEIVKKVEEEFGCYVFHAIHNIAEFGELYSLLIISKYKEDWEYIFDDLEYGIVFSYVVNKTYPDYSEFGSISVKESIGGLVRLY